MHGKSQVELDHHAAADRVFGRAASGQSVRDDAFTHRDVWLIDIVTETASGQKVAVEYDGAYWHAGKAELDREKSRDLLAAGYFVARLREHPLPTLDIAHTRYVEFTVYSGAPKPDETMERVRRWVDGSG